MAKFATNTNVSTEKSRAELETTLSRYGATGFRYGWAEKEGKRVEQIDFQAKDRTVRFVLLMPSQNDREFALTPAKKLRRNDQQRYEAWEQACRQRWRALCLAVKAKLECVEVGISEFESEFLAHIVDPETNRTVGDTIRPQLESVYSGAGGRISLIGLPSPDQFADAEA